MPKANFSNPSGVIATKRMALDAYTKWKIEQLTPMVQQWAIDGADLAEIERRLGKFKGEVFDEAERALQLVTIEALKDGGFDG